MSLKDHLGDKNSPVRQFLRTQFPSTRTFLADSRKHIRQSYTIRQDADVPWSKIGTALDYRIRYYFAVTPYQELVAYRGTLRLSDAQVHNPTGSPLATRANGDSITIFDRSTGRIVGMYFPEHNGGAALDQSVSICDVLAIGREAAERNAGIESDGDSPLTEALEDFFCRLHSLTKRRSPVGTRLSLAEEDELNRYCFVVSTDGRGGQDRQARRRTWRRVNSATPSLCSAWPSPIGSTTLPNCLGNSTMASIISCDFLTCSIQDSMDREMSVGQTPT